MCMQGADVGSLFLEYFFMYLEFLPGTVFSAILILISSALQEATCVSLLIPLCSQALGFYKIVRAEFELHIRVAFAGIG